MGDSRVLAELLVAEVRERRRTKGSKDPLVARFKSEVSSPPRAYKTQGLALPFLMICCTMTAAHDEGVISTCSAEVLQQVS